MKISVFRKIFSILLCFVILFSTAPLSALALTFENSPIIYIGGMSDNILYSNPNKLNASVVHNIYSKEFLQHATKILGALLIASSDDVDVNTELPIVLEAVKGIMDPIKCSETGVSAKENIGPWEYREPISLHSRDEIYTNNMQALIKAAAGKIDDDKIFWFSYDWRLDPTDAADKLCDFIEHVKKTTGSERVSLLASAYGGIIANAYLYKYEESAKENIDSCVFLNAPLLGNAVIDDFMRGKIARTLDDEESLIGLSSVITGEQRGEAFFNYIEADPLGIIKMVFDSFLGSGPHSAFFNALFYIIALNVLKGEDVHKDLGKAYNEFVLVADKTVYDECLSEYLRNMPGLWALVSEKNLDAAKEFIFDRKELDPELEKRIDAYREVVNSTEDTLKKAQINGINVCIVANYGVQLIPATISMNDLSDGIESVKYTSAGAVTPDCSNEDYLKRCMQEHDHKSPDKDIDAATCFLPENTWFIKDLGHSSFTCDSAAQFIVWLLTAASQRNIYENANYPQYMKYSTYAKSIKPYLSVGSGNSQYQYGDLDIDGIVAAADARIALRYAVGLEEQPSKVMTLIADVDGDEKITASDARLILRYSVGLEAVFPVERK